MRYGLLVGHPSKSAIFARFPGNPPHYHITVQGAGGQELDAAVNIQSVDGSEVLYAIRPDEPPPHADLLLKMNAGLQELWGELREYRIDYLRMHLVTREQMQLLPIEAGQEHELHSELDNFMTRATTDPRSIVYVYGELYPTHDGLHGTHMNQGNPPGQYAEVNGIWQDGAVFAYFPEQKRWWSLFMAFQSQSFHTDERGNPIGS